MSSDSICIDVFKDHWNKALHIINSVSDVNSSDIIFKHVDIMISIIIKQCDEESPALNDVLDFCDEHVIFQTILIHFNRDNLPGSIRESGIINQLKVYDNLLNFLSTEHMLRKNIVYSMIKLLEECSIRSSVKIEQLSVHLLYHLTVLVTRDEILFDFIKQVSNIHYNEPFFFIHLIILMIHRDKDIGRLSQEAMLLLLNYCRNEDGDLVNYICVRSDFCAILTTVLSGLYSSFPRKLENLPDDWQQITKEHAHSITEIVQSLQLLDFINLALKMSHPRIQTEILEFLYNGFLSPVIGPSLHQNSLEETISATAYLEMFLRHLHDPSLIQLFLQFIMTEQKENYAVLDSLINRLTSITMDTVAGMYTLGVVTLSLFRTILSFHCEDVMFNLVLKYLIPCNHYIKQKWQGLSTGVTSRIMNSDKYQHRDQILEKKMNEDFSNSAEQFLKISLGIYSEDSNFVYISQAPSNSNNIDLEQRRASINPVILDNLKRYSLASPFHSYLQTSAIFVNRRIHATEDWRFTYDAVNSPPPNVFDTLDDALDPRWPNPNKMVLFPTHTSMISADLKNTVYDEDDDLDDGDDHNYGIADASIEPDGHITPETYYTHQHQRGHSSETVVIIEEEDEVSTNHSNQDQNKAQIERVSKATDSEITRKYQRHAKRQRAHSNENGNSTSIETVSRTIICSNDTTAETTPRDIGYFSHSNNGSAVGSHSLANTNAVSTNQLPELLDNDFDGSYRRRKRYMKKLESNKRNLPNQNRDLSTLEKKLSQSTQSIYKLHYEVFDLTDDEGDDGLEDDNDEEVDVSKKNGKEENKMLRNDDQIDDVMERSQINMDNVLLSCPGECDLSEFIVSLNLLQIHKSTTSTSGDDSSSNHYSNWKIDWDNVTHLLIDHNVDLMLSAYSVDDDHYTPYYTRHGDDDDDSDEEKRMYGNDHDNDRCVQAQDHNNECYPGDDDDTNSISTPTNEACFKRRLQSFDNSLYTSPAHINSSVTLGPFLAAIFQRLSVLSTNTLFMNLLITGIITDLASYPHPLIKNLLLDVDVILQPNIAKLFEILSDVRLKLTDHASNISNWENILENAYEYLFYRISTTNNTTTTRRLSNFRNSTSIIPEESGKHDFQMMDFNDQMIGSINVVSDDFRNILNISSEHKKQEIKPKRSPFGLLQRKKKKPDIPQYRFPVSKFSYNSSSPSSSSPFNITRRSSNSSSSSTHSSPKSTPALLVSSRTCEYEPQRCRNLAYSWIVFDEFCKELASLCQEHTLHCFF